MWTRGDTGGYGRTRRATRGYHGIVWDAVGYEGYWGIREDAERGGIIGDCARDKTIPLSHSHPSTLSHTHIHCYPSIGRGLDMVQLLAGRILDMVFFLIARLSITTKPRNPTLLTARSKKLMHASPRSRANPHCSEQEVKNSCMHAGYVIRMQGTSSAARLTQKCKQ